jgi:signal transduction histidine kinase
LVWGNPTALEEVVSNLLKNAIQYTPAGGEVVLRMRPRVRERKVELIVQDTGVGIPEDDLLYIFEPFYRSEKSLHMYHQGNGLGLPLVKQIVNRHDGSIDVQSTPGKGTVVTVKIPMAPAEAAAAKAEAEADKK